MTKIEAIKFYKKLYWLRLDLSQQDEKKLDEVLDEMQEKFCKQGCRNGDLTDGGLFTPVKWCDCPLGVECSKARVTIV